MAVDGESGVEGRLGRQCVRVRVRVCVCFCKFQKIRVCRWEKVVGAD